MTKPRPKPYHPAAPAEGWTERGKAWLAAGAPVGEEYRHFVADVPAQPSRGAA